MKWYLISEEDTEYIRDGLTASTHDENDYNCPNDRPVWGSCSACKGDEERRQALHCLDSGLHITDSIPDDFKEVK